MNESQANVIRLNARREQALEDSDANLAALLYDCIELKHENDALAQQLQIAIDALEFMTMPIISKIRTVEDMLETIENDTKRGKEALSKIEAMSKDNK